MILKLPEQHLHIVCLDVPYPVDYGGVFDLFYKIKTLYEKGIKIHLHCFEYGRGEQPELDKFCEEVNYYKRHQGLSGFSLKVPYIVNSRKNILLLESLLKDDHPILLEGIHCTCFLNSGDLKNRNVFVRLHNVEFEYYRQLSRSENSLPKKIYFLFESFLLKKYERNICSKATFLAVSEKDVDTYKNLGSFNVKYLPVFMPFEKINIKSGLGNYCLYHGNLSVNENEKAALWLIENVFKDLQIEFIIAGKSPGKKIINAAKENKNILIIADLDKNTMQQLINNAQINILPSFNSTGVKIKLINALFEGRHCIVNTQAIEGTDLENLCLIADDALQMKQKIIEVFHQPFTENGIEKRKEKLESIYNNRTNADKIIQWIHLHYR